MFWVSKLPSLMSVVEPGVVDGMMLGFISLILALFDLLASFEDCPKRHYRELGVAQYVGLPKVANYSERSL
jgi:hypothetical protein